MIQGIKTKNIKQRIRERIREFTTGSFSMEEFNLDIYNNCLTNISNSILNYYNIKKFHNSNKQIDDKLLKDSPDNIILILLDGLGSSILNYHLREDDFLRRNKITDIFSVLPTTTTAATTSLMSGLNPIEHGWLGWDMYFRDLNKIVTLFTNNLKDTKEQAEKYNVAQTKIKYDSIFDLISNKNENINIETMFPFGANKYDKFEDAVIKAKDLTKKYKKNFIYIYCDNPDKIMHKTGTKSKETQNIIKKLNNSIELLADNVKKTTIIVLADHGHINSKPIFLTDYPELLKTLRMDISIESRACAFFVKKHKMEDFKRIFNKEFSKYFILYSKEEVISYNMFGFGKKNKYFEDAIGDFIAFGTSNRYFRSNKNCEQFKSQHAGITQDEVKIPLIIK